jgi:hypothetical protein
MQPQKNNAGRLRVTGTAKGFQSFGQYSTDEIKELAKQLKEERLRRDNSALRLPPLRCGCRDPLHCRCMKAGAA